jgi:hypothetical protein
VYNFNLPQGIEPHYTRYITYITSLITRTKPLSGYIEKHHILPKSMGGVEDKSNIIHLTAKEHFIAHHILWKCGYITMKSCFFIMSHQKTSTGEWGRRLTLKEYILLKEDFIEHCLKRNKFSIGRICSIETKLKISKSHKGKKLSPEHLAHLMGRPVSETTRKKIAESNRGQKRSEGSKQKMRESRLKFMQEHPEEAKAFASKGQKGKILSNGRASKVLNLDTKEIFESISLASFSYPKANRTAIGMCCRGERKTAGKHRWAYAD